MTKKISAWAMFLRAFVVTLFAGSAATQAQEPGLTDDAAWAIAASLGTSEAIRDYLRNFPTGDHIEAAVKYLLSISELSGTSPLPAPANLPYLRPAAEGEELY